MIQMSLILSFVFFYPFWESECEKKSNSSCSLDSMWWNRFFFREWIRGLCLLPHLCCHYLTPLCLCALYSIYECLITFPSIHPLQVSFSKNHTRHHTSSSMRTLNPIYTHTFSFLFPPISFSFHIFLLCAHHYPSSIMYILSYPFSSPFEPVFFFFFMWIAVQIQFRRSWASSIDHFQDT